MYQCKLSELGIECAPKRIGFRLYCIPNELKHSLNVLNALNSKTQLIQIGTVPISSLFSLLFLLQQHFAINKLRALSNVSLKLKYSKSLFKSHFICITNLLRCILKFKSKRVAYALSIVNFAIPDTLTCSSSAS